MHSPAENTDDSAGKAKASWGDPHQVVSLPFSGDNIVRQSGAQFLLADIAALLIAFMLAGIAAWGTNKLVGDGFQHFLTSGSIKQFLLFISLGALAILWLDQRGHYRLRLPYWERTGNVVTVVAVGLLIGGFAQFALKNDFSRLWLGYSWLFFGLLVFGLRTFVRANLDRRGEWRIPALLVGNGPTAEAIESALEAEGSMGYDVVARVSDDQLVKLQEPRDWQRLLQEKGASYLLLALEGGTLERAQSALRAAVRARLPYIIVPPWLGLPSSGLTPHTFFTHDVMILHSVNRLSLPLPRIMKRGFDLVVASLLLLILSPVMLAIAMVCRRDGGAAIYVSRRVGEHGASFGCYKFRSMRADGDAIFQKHLTENVEAAAEWATYQKLRDDPRITKFGHFIRKTSLDELPQLFNVLKGDMSLVGPRPITEGQEVLYGDDFTFYAVMRPGITGPWQVSGRNSVTFEKRVQLECWYARNWSLWMDIVILIKTIPVVLKRDQVF